MIPLGIHADGFKPGAVVESEESTENSVKCCRGSLDWTARNAFKAHHGTSFRALAHAAVACPQRPWVLLMYGNAVMPSITPALKQAAAALCPDVEVRLLDGHDLDLGKIARAASDMALSLVDCLQETFGLTPVEAMARPSW